MNFKTADLCDEFGNELEVCQLEFKSYGKRSKFSGPVATVRVFEDNVLVLESLETVPEGSVLVVDGGGSRRCALMGDRLGKIAQDRKLAGIIINGCVRDSEDLGQLDIGILAIGTNPLRSKKDGKGERQIPVFFGNIDWTPESHVYADGDGVILSKGKLF
ncbi:ribonuclease E activity regulator RraA [Mesobacillus foraminis]|uniref:4-hydroxy-4-methyl-2-oxoglutarate aldolase n=1 Tax=Mesobacillus foraminis TaxID=279826 RepID=A0A4R2B660_9BACI|nr:ribonuclease E activity regulator RraA [Mesobacillus foraminis]TCN22227.1 regulator of ribonuclease activity A [Mesobacillus foraminis]